MSGSSTPPTPATPPTPPSSMASSESVSRFKPMYTACEHVDQYHPTGLHPVDLGDVLSGRYRVIRKLGYGGFSTVWLAENMEDGGGGGAYVALKIYEARMKTARELTVTAMLVSHARADPDAGFVLLPSDLFELDGPNGHHICLAVPPMGPCLADYIDDLPRQTGDSGSHRGTRPISTPAIRCGLRNILRGLRFLHRHGAVHGDLHQGNVLVGLRGLAAADRSRLEQKNGANFSRERNLIVRRDGAADRWAPKYLVCPQPLSRGFALPPGELALGVADLSAAFFADAPPPAASVVTPSYCRAPELILPDDDGGRVGPPLDIWSFGQFMYIALTSEMPLVDPCCGSKEKQVVDDSHLIQLAETLGPLPDDLRARWPRHGLYFGPGGERLRIDPSHPGFISCFFIFFYCL